MWQSDIKYGPYLTVIEVTAGTIRLAPNDAGKITYSVAPATNVAIKFTENHISSPIKLCYYLMRQYIK